MSTVQDILFTKIMVVVVFVFISEGENNDEQICQTTEVEILPSIDFCKFQ